MNYTTIKQAVCFSTKQAEFDRFSRKSLQRVFPFVLIPNSRDLWPSYNTTQNKKKMKKNFSIYVLTLLVYFQRGDGDRTQFFYCFTVTADSQKVRNTLLLIAVRSLKVLFDPHSIAKIKTPISEEPILMHLVLVKQQPCSVCSYTYFRAGGSFFLLLFHFGDISLSRLNTRLSISLRRVVLSKQESK